MKKKVSHFAIVFSKFQSNLNRNVLIDKEGRNKYVRGYDQVYINLGSWF